MTTLRCTRKVLDRLGGESAEGPSALRGALGDWYCNLKSLPYRGRSVVFFVNEATRLTVVVPGRASRRVLPLFRERTLALLSRLDVPEAALEREAEALAELRLARTQSRSVLGSMVEIGLEIDAMAEASETFQAISWDSIELELSDWLHGPLDYERPWRIAQRLLRETRQPTLAKVLPFRPRS